MKREFFYRNFLCGLNGQLPMPERSVQRDHRWKSRMTSQIDCDTPVSTYHQTRISTFFIECLLPFLFAFQEYVYILTFCSIVSFFLLFILFLFLISVFFSLHFLSSCLSFFSVVLHWNFFNCQRNCLFLNFFPDYSDFLTSFYSIFILPLLLFFFISTFLFFSLAYFILVLLSLSISFHSLQPFLSFSSSSFILSLLSISFSFLSLQPFLSFFSHLLSF